MAQSLIRPILTVDVVLLALMDGEIRVGLQKRDRPPHRGRAALVGGYVRPEEDASTTNAAIRVLREKTGFAPRLLEQLMTFSGADRDPRGWSASVAYCALLPGEAAVPALDWRPIKRAADLPFDHELIVAKAMERCRRRAGYSSLPAFMLPKAFTLSALRGAYEVLLGRTLNDSAFRRKVHELRLVEPLGAASRATARPAQLFRLSAEQVVEFDRTI
jgi:8-oxo-dGTP diphosphatase